MWIRSQDKLNLTNMDNIESIIVCENILLKNGQFEIRVYPSTLTLGKYSAEQKAISVLDMIQSAYIGQPTDSYIGSGYKDTKVFQMPLDSEVE